MLKVLWKTLADSEGWRAAFILSSILQVCFFPCIWGNKTLLESAGDAPSILASGAAAGQHIHQRFARVADPGAAAWQTEPWFAFIGDQYRHATLPLWDPYQAFGKPLAADMQSQPFYPLTFALSLHLSPRTYNLYILLRLLLAGICTFFYLRLFVSFTAAISGGIASMLAGYYVIYLTMPHLSVEVLLPATLLAGEQLIRNRTYKTLAWLSIVVALVFLGGMPESALLLLTFATVYLLFRVFSDSELRSKCMTEIGLLSTAAVLSICLSSFQLLPFYELVTSSSNSHDPAYMEGLITGLLHDKLDLSVLTYFFPLLFGPIYSSSLFHYQQFRNYIGLIIVFLIIIALVAIRPRDKGRDPHPDALACFFGVAIFLILLKQYGCIAVNWVGALPSFRLVDFRKYDEPILSFCVSVLCAIGVDRLIRNEISRQLQAYSLVTTSLLLAAGFFLSRSTVRKEITYTHLPRDIPRLALAFPGILLVFVLLAMILRWRQHWAVNGRESGKNSWFSIVIVTLITAELSLNYVTPMYRIYNHIPSIQSNPYVGSAFIRFLQSKSRNYYRIFGRDWTFVPSWASVFMLFDVRDMDGLYYDKYFPFVRNFSPLQHEQLTELYSSMLGRGSYEFNLPVQKRLLQLSSIKYMVTNRPFVTHNARVDEVLQQNRGHLLPGRENLVGRRDFVLNGIAREGLGEHPPYERLPYKLKLSNSQAKFQFSYALDPAVFDKTSGEGVWFTIEVKDSSGPIQKVFSKYIDPKHNPQERRWMDGDIDLSRYRGQQIELLFSTDPGPKGDASWDWAAWSDFRFEGERNDPELKPAYPEFKLIYNGEVKVFEYDHVLPRAAIYYQADVERNETEALQKLADPVLDVFRTVVLNASKLSKSQAIAVAGVNHGSVTTAEPARIRFYRSQEVEIEASLKRSGILVLNDTDYPGWVVYVDGRRGEWFTANYLFRGVLLGPGAHIVRFAYRPTSFYSGAAISFVTCSCLAGFAFVRRKKRRDSLRDSLPKPVSHLEVPN